MAQAKPKPDPDMPADTVSAADHQAVLDENAALKNELALVNSLLEEEHAKTAPVALVTTNPIAAPPPQLTPPADLPAGFVFNTITGQQWCGQCRTEPLDQTATSFACDHGSWQAATQTFTPDEV